MKYPLKIIIIDDHPTVLEGLAALLCEGGHLEVIRTFTDGYQAAREIAYLNADVILSDMNMPYFNGFQTARAILSRKPNARIILLTMEISKAILLRAQNEGIKACISKNASIEDIRQTIRKVYLEKELFC